MLIHESSFSDRHRCSHDHGVLVSPVVAHPGTRSGPLNEDAALDLLQLTLKRDRVYEKRISCDCISYSTEETTSAYFEFVVREIHNTKCGGDLDVTSRY